MTDLAISFCKRVEILLTGASITILNFDSYNDDPCNLKANTWDHRNKKQIRYNLSANTNISKIKLKDLLSHPENKQKLAKIFSNEFARVCREKGQSYVIAFGFEIVTNIAEWTKTEHSHYEADTLLICCLNEAHRLFPSCWFEVATPDTDVLVLLIYYLAQLPSALTIWLRMMSNKGSRLISVNEIYIKLGQERAEAILGAYVSTGCDHIGRFNGITKARCFNVFMELSPNGSPLRALSSLGNTETLSPRVVSGLTAFVIQLHCSKRKDDGARFGHIDDIGKLRWEMYSKHQTEGENLPPTPSALNFHLLRSNYVCFLLKNSSLNFHQRYLPLETIMVGT